MDIWFFFFSCVWYIYCVGWYTTKLTFDLSNPKFLNVRFGLGFFFLHLLSLLFLFFSFNLLLHISILTCFYWCLCIESTGFSQLVEWGRYDILILCVFIILLLLLWYMEFVRQWNSVFYLAINTIPITLYGLLNENSDFYFAL